MRDLPEINLNLLLSLEALLAEVNVTRAARRLGVTQPTMSRALRRLREDLGDPLLVRSGQGLVRTPRAERIHASLRDGLRALRRVLHDEEFDPATARDTITMAAHDIVGVFVLPALLRLQRSREMTHLRSREMVHPSRGQFVRWEPLCRLAHARARRGPVRS